MIADIDKIVDTFIGKYNPLIVPIYLWISSGINKSDNGEFFFNRSVLIRSLEYGVGSGGRKINVSRKTVRTCMSILWDNCLIDFAPTTRGFYARCPTKKNKQWKSIGVSI
jgi:hypothetical protein